MIQKHFILSSSNNVNYEKNKEKNYEEKKDFTEAYMHNY